jgi:hypothetical protein
MISFPAHVVRCPGPYVLASGLAYACKTVNDDAELQAARADGWHLTLQEAKDAAGDKAFIKRKVAPWRKVKKTKKTPVASTAKHATAISVAEPDPVDDNSPPTRQELEQKATMLGIKFDGRTSDKKLGERITQVIEGQP